MRLKAIKRSIVDTESPLGGGRFLRVARTEEDFAAIAPLLAAGPEAVHLLRAAIAGTADAAAEATLRGLQAPPWRDDARTLLSRLGLM